MQRRLVVPEELHRNDPNVHALGPEHTGSTLIRLASQRLGLADLSEMDVLDVGCGVRFTQAIINCELPIKSYTGIDVHRPLIDWLCQSVGDARFRFAHWDVKNAMYHPSGAELSVRSRLPVDGPFDVIWLFSVFTHLDPSDANAMLAILRRYVRQTGQLFFSVCLDEAVPNFEDRTPEQPLQNACYHPDYLRDLVEANGWSVVAMHPRSYADYILEHVTCRPAPASRTD